MADEPAHFRANDLVSLLRRRALEQPDDPAYIFLHNGEEETHRLTYRELDQRCCQVAASLQSLAMPRDRVLLLLPQSIDYIIAFYACLYAGLIAVPAYPPKSARNLPRIQGIALDSQAQIVLTTTKILGQIGELVEQIPDLKRLHWQAVETMNVDAETYKSPKLDHDTIAFLQYTSGSTSAPKGVMVSHGNLLANHKLIRQASGNTKNTVTISWLPLFHDLGLIGTMMHSMVLGGLCVLMSPMAFIQRPIRWLRAINKYRGTYTAAPNFAYDLIADKITKAEKAELDLSCWQVAMNAAEPVNAETVKRFSEALATCGFRPEAMCPWYGLAEGTLIVSACKSTEIPIIRRVEAEALELGQVVEADRHQTNTREVVSCGEIWGDDEVIIVDPATNQVVDEAVIGEVWVKGPSVAVGYWNKPEVSEATLGAHRSDNGDGPYLRTGDLGFLLEDDLFISGRIKDLIIIRGQNHYPQDIEWSAERAHPDLRSAGNAAFVIAESGADHLVIVQEVTRKALKKTLDVAAIAQALRRVLAEDHGLQLDALVLIRPMTIPKTSSGKIQRHACKLQFKKRSLPGIVGQWQAKPVTATTPVPRKMPTRKDAAGIQFWLVVQLAAILGIVEDDVDVEAPIIHYGLDSMTVMALIGDLEIWLGRRLSLNLVWDYPRIDVLAKHLSKSLATSSSSGALLQLAPIEADQQAAHQPFPLNDIQQAYWLGRRSVFELGQVACHLYFEMESHGIDVERLQQALQQVIARHDMLRAVIDSNGQQRILESVPPYVIQVFDMRSQRTLDIDKHLEEIREQMQAQVLATDNWPLFDIRVHRLRRRRKRLHFSFDLLIADLWSLQILFKDLATCYNDPETQLPPLSLHFRDYVLAERSLQQAPMMQPSWDYWQARLANLPPAPELPLACRPGDIDKPCFKRYQFRFKARLWQSLKNRAAQADLTPSMLLCAAFAEVLATWSKSARFTLNVTLFNRLPLHAQVEEIIGDFTTLELLQVEHSGHDPFEKRARAIQRQLLDDLTHRHLNGIRLMQAFSAGSEQLIQLPVVFTSALPIHALTHSPIFPSGWLGERIFTVSQTPQVWLDHQVYEENDDLLISWDVIEDLFPERLVDEMFGAYRQLLRVLARDGNVWWDHNLNLIPDYQLALFADVNATKHSLPVGLLQDGFFKHAQNQPANTALISTAKQLSYGDVASRANRIARQLRDWGVKPNQLVAIVMEKGWQQAVACLGILQSGGAYVPLDPGLPQERLWLLLEKTKVQHVLTQKRVQQSLHWPEQLTVSAVDGSDFDAVDDADLAILQRPTDLAYVIFTSGSTGLPKGVMIDHRGALNTIQDINLRFQVGAQDRLFALSNLNFDLSVYDLFGCFDAGAALVIPDAQREREPAHWLQMLEAHAISIWNSVPALAAMLAAHLPAHTQLPKLRLVLLSGDWIPLDLPDKLRSFNSNTAVISLGGATEASIWSIIYPITEVLPEWRSIPYGTPLLNQRFYVLDAAHRQCPVWVPGQLAIAGTGVAQGYWEDIERTKAHFIEDPGTGECLYLTGDFGRYLPDGALEFLGRDDFQVKIRGYRIELGEIEAVLGQHQDISACVVDVWNDDQIAHLVAFVVFASAQALTPADMRTWLAAKLPDYMVPRLYQVIDAIPLTANGKIDRKALPLPNRDSVVALRQFIVPQTSTEIWLASLWRELLKVERIGTLDNFFELGGDSLAATRVVVRVRDNFQVAIPLSGFFNELSHIAALATFIDAETTPQQLPDDSMTLHADFANRYQPFPLDAIQHAYWMGRHGAFPLGNIACHFYLEMNCNNLDLARLQTAWNRIIARHDMLRAVILADGSGQQVLQHVPEYQIQAVDLRTTSAEETERQLQALRERMADQILPTDNWPLFEIRAHLLDNGTTRLHFSFDLLVADVWSFLVFSGEWHQLYRTPEIELAPLNLLFRDYVLAEHQIQASTAWKTSWNYWQQRLTALPRGPELPLACQPASIHRPRFNRLDKHLDKVAWQRFQDQARAHNLTASIVLCAAFAEVLAQWSKTSSFTLNLTLFNRLPVHPQVNDLVGDFTSLELLQVNHQANLPFVERARLLQQQLLTDLEHRIVNGIDVMRAMSRELGSGSSVVMPVVFTSALPIQDNEGIEQFPLSWLGEKVFAITQTPQVWLDHQVFIENDQLVLSWDVVDALFPPGMIGEMFGAYTTLVGRLAEDATVWQHLDLDLIPQSQRLTFAAVNETCAPIADGCLQAGFFHHAEKNPELVALLTPGKSFSYGAVALMANTLGERLRHHGAQPNQLVAVVMRKGWEQAVACLSILQSGAAYVPLDPELPAERLDYLFAHTGISQVITQPELAQRLSWPDGVLVHCLDENLAPTSGRADVKPLLVVAHPTDLAYVIFTSGSTGLPKGVMIDHRGALNTIVDINRRFSLTSADRVLALSNLNFDLSVYDVFGCFQAGGALVIPVADEEREPAHWLHLISEYQVSIWNSVPALAGMLVAHAPEATRLASLRLMLLSGDWIPLDLPDKVRNLNPATAVISLGGATEASIWSVIYPIAKIALNWPSIPYGKPLINQTLTVLDESLRPSPAWVPGEIHIGGIGLAKGYWQDAEKTQAQFIEHPQTGERLYKTGDLGRYLPDGIIEFLGRDDFQVKIQGYRIELGEIEAALMTHPDISGCVVSVWDDGKAKHLVAYIVFVPQDVPASDGLQQWLRAKLPRYMVPRLFLPIATIPLTANGKVDRKALPPPDRDQEQKTHESVAPQNAEQEWLAGCFTEVLQLQNIGIYDNFFEWGGDSLTATRAVAQIRQQFRVDLPLAAFFQQSTIAEISALITTTPTLVNDAVSTLAQVEPNLATRLNPFPLNEIQQAYWMGRRNTFELGNISCHFYLEAEHDALDLNALEKAWQLLIARHDMLRAIINADGYQQVLEEVPDYLIATTDVSGWSAEATEEHHLQARLALADQVLPTASWPLFEIRAHRLGGKRVRLFMSFDLLVADVWSFIILFREWQQLYLDVNTVLPTLTLRFRDYIMAERQAVADGVFARDLQYWLDRLDDLPGGPELPLAQQPSAIKQPHFVRHQATLEVAPWNLLKQRAITHGLTPSMLLCALYADILARWSATPNFMLNVTQFNRLPLHPQVNDIVGDFTSLILLHVDFSGGGDFLQRAQSLQTQMLQDMEHRHVSGVQLLRELSQKHGKKVAMPVVFTSALPIQDEAAVSPVAWLGKKIFHISQTPQVWMDFQIFEESGELVYSWDVVADLFPDGMIRDMFAGFSQCLGQLADVDALWRAKTFNFGMSEHLNLYRAVNATTAPQPEGRLHDGFFEQAARHPERVALIAPECRLSYGEVAARAVAIANGLHQAGVQVNDRVAIVMHKGWQQTVAVMGILQSGATFVPMDPELPKERLWFLLQHTESRHVLTQTAVKTQLDWPSATAVFSVDGDDFATAALPVLPPLQTPDDLAYIIFTSGSTGLPKGVMINHKGALNTIVDINSRYQVGPEDRLLALSNLNFDLSIYDVFGSLNAGAALVIPEARREREPAHWLQLIAEAGVSVWNSVPALMKMLVDHINLSDQVISTNILNRLRLVLLSGDWLPLDLPAKIKQLQQGIAVISLGGATEASIWSIIYPINQIDASWRSIPYGKPMVNQQFYIFDAQLNNRPLWVAGELYIGGVGLAQGYWRDPEKTAACFISHPFTGERLYRTGDLGRYLADGTIEFLGRNDFQVKIQGYRIELGEIEAAIASFALIDSVVVTARKINAADDNSGNRQLVAYLVGDFEQQDLLRFLRAKLPSYMVPHHLVALTELPLTANGKIDRKALPDPAVKDAEEKCFVAPKTTVESWLVENLQNLIGLADISTDDGFFALGGDSLIATRLVNRIRDHFSVDFSLSAFFRHADSLICLAEHIESVPTQVITDIAADEQLVVDAANRYQPFPLNDIQQAYWLGRQGAFVLGNVACHFYSERIVAGLDLERLNVTWNLTIARHDMLRAIINPDGQQQVLETTPPYEIRAIDARGWRPHQLEASVLQTREELVSQMFNTEIWPIFDIRAHILDDDQLRLHFSFDFLISDVWSFLIIFDEWSQLYQNPDLCFQPLNVNFRDYVLAERNLQAKAGEQDAWNYWLERIKTMPPGPELPLAKNPADIVAPEFVRYGKELSKQQWTRLKARASKAQLTPSMLLCAAYAEVVGRWSKRADFTLNLTLFNRLPLHDQIQDIVGDFTTLTLLERKVQGLTTFAQRATQLQAQLMQDLEHRQINGIRILREYGRIRGDAVSATMPVVFTSALPLKDAQSEQTFPTNWLGEQVFSVSQTPQVWMDHHVYEENGGLILSWDVVAALFPDGMIDQMFTLYHQFLLQLTDDESIWHSPYPLKLTVEQERARELYNATLAPVPPGLLQQPFVAMAEANPQRLAILAPDLNMSYGELLARSQVVASNLLATDIAAHSLVAVVMDKGWEQAVACFGILQAGCAYLPIDPSLPEERLWFLLEEGNVEHVLTQSWLKSRLRWPKTDIAITAVNRLATQLTHTFTPVNVQPTDLAYVIFTSGSTGKPKGVMIDHRGALNTVIDINVRHAISSHDRILAISSLSFDLSVYDIFGTFAAGATLVIPAADQEREPAYWAELVGAQSVSVWNSAPPLMKMFMDWGEGGLLDTSSLRVVMLSGDWIPVDLPDQIWRHNAKTQVVSMGGATEASIWSIDYPIIESHASRTSIPYGRPLKNQSLYVLNDALQNCPDWVAGELYIGGIGLAIGYMNDSEKTAAHFIRHPLTSDRLYRTGDLGRFLPDGNIEFLGREDHQVKIQGYRIELGEIESAISRYPGVSANAVVAQAAGDSRNRKLFAYVVGDFATAALSQWLHTCLPAYMVPKSFVKLDALPLSANGKVDRKALPTTTQITTPKGSSTPQTVIQHWLVEHWQEMLACDAVSIDDNFFDLGGDSLIATRMVTRICQNFQVDVTLRRFFEAENIAALATVIECGAPAGGPIEADIVGLTPEPANWFEPFPLNSIQQAYWLGRQGGFELGDVACHIYLELDSKGLQIDRLEAAWRAVIQRHDMLRAVILPDGRQQILADVPDYRFPVLDLRDADHDVCEAILSQQREELAHQLFATDKWPLFDIRLALLPDGGLRLHFSFDLLLADVFSLMLLFSEWQKYYQNIEIKLPPLMLSFRDYVLAEREFSNGAAYAHDWVYWEARLDHIPPPPSLPLACDPSAIKTPRFRRHKGRLAPSQWGALKLRAQHLKMTPSMILCGLYAEMLGHWSQDGHFTLNLTLFNRLPLHAQVQEIVGDFTSLLLLEVVLDPAKPLIERLQALQSQLFADLEYRNVSGVKVMRAMAARSNTGTVSMPVIFTSALPIGTTAEIVAEGMPYWLGEVAYSITQTPQVWLDHQVYEEAGALIYTWDFVEDLFPHGLIDTMFAAYSRLLVALTEGDELWQQTALPWMAADELTLLRKFNASNVILPQGLLHAAFIKQAENHPDRLALLAPRRSLTYHQLWTQSLQLTHHLQTLEVEPGQIVAVVMAKGWEQVVACLAILQAGAAYLPIAADAPLALLSDVMQQAGVHVVLTQKQLDTTLTWPAGIITVAVDTLQPKADIEPIACPAHPEDLAYVSFATGADGKQHGAMIEHGAALNTLLDVNRRFHLNASDRVAAMFALTVDAAIYDMFAPLSMGGAVIIPDAQQQHDFGYWAKLLQDQHVTVCNSTAAWLKALLDFGAGWKTFDLSSVRLWLLSGDRIPTDLPAELWQVQNTVHLVGLGGVPAASIWSVYTPILQAPAGQANIPYERPLANQRLHVLTPSLAPCPCWVTGHLYIAGSGLARGYLNNQEATLAAFINHPETGERLYRTGNLARFLGDGRIELLGREDLQIKLHGFRIELAEVEAVISKFSGVESAVVILWDPLLSEYANNERSVLVACVVGEVNTPELLEFMRTQLPHYMIPASIIVLDTLPLTRLGSLDRAALPKPQSLLTGTQAISSTSADTGAPASATADWLVATWQNLLGLDEIDSHRNFFDMGGDSLIATRIVAAIRDHFHIDLALAQFFSQGTTIAALAELLTRLTQSGNAAARDEELPQLVVNQDQRNAPFPLNEVQQAYWMGRQDDFELGNIACHLYMELDADNLDIGKLNLAWQHLIERHDMLRAVILPDGRQQVLAQVPKYQIEVESVAELTAKARTQRLLDIRAAMEANVLPAEQWPLFEIRSTRISADRSRLHIGFDLLIADVWSFFILSREWALLYADSNTVLPPIAVFFRDYVLAENQFRASAMYRRAWSYWQTRLDTLPLAPQLPLVQDPQNIERPRFVRLNKIIDAATWEKLQRRGRAQQITPSMLLCTAYAEVLARWSTSAQFCLNLTLFNRLPVHADINAIVGDFTSLMLLAIETNSTQTFMTKARTNQSRFMADLEHRAVNGVTLMRELARRHGGGKAAVMPVIFTSALPIGDDDTVISNSWLGEQVYAITQTPQVWLDMQVFESEGELHISWDVVPELFPSGMLEQMFATLCGLLQRLAADDEAWRSTNLAALPASDAAMLVDYNQTSGIIPHGLLHQGFLYRGQSYSQNLAIIAPDRTLTYGEVLHLALTLAQRLREAHVVPNQLVAIVMDKGWEQAVACLGILHAGAAYLPIDPKLPQQRIDMLLHEGGVKQAVIQSWLQPKIAWPSALELIAVDDLQAMHEHTGALTCPAQPDDLAYVIFTSGSTGTPKGVMISHRAALNTVADINRRFLIEPTDRCLALSNLNFDLSVYDLLGILNAGGTVVIPRSEQEREPAHWLDLIRDQRVSVWNSAPALMKMLVDHAPKTTILPSLRLVLLSGDWIPVDLPASIRDLQPNANIISLGGATEAAIWSIFYPITKVAAHWRSIPYGRPLRNQHVYVLDADLSACPLWVTGGIYIGGIGLAAGYRNDKPRTDASFLHHPVTGERLYRTGDLGRFLPDGVIEFLGREDFQVKIKGYRIELGEIETHLIQHQSLADCVVTVFGDGETRQLVAYFVPTNQQDVDPEILRSYLIAKLPDYMVPRLFIRLDRIPLTANGKVDRQSLPAPDRSDADRVGFVAPQNAVQTWIVSCWSDLLENTTIGIYDNFLELGGNSLQATQFVSRLRKQFKVEMSLRNFFADPTTVGLANRIEAATEPSAERDSSQDQDRGVLNLSANQETVALVAIERTQALPLSFAQERMWFSEQWSPGNAAYHLPTAVHLQGPLNQDALSFALDTVLRRHEVLRASFVTLDGEPMQQFSKSEKFELQHATLQPEPGESQDDALTRELRAQALVAFDFIDGPLIRGCLWQLGIDDHILAITLHHIIADGWSLGILAREISEFYQVYSAGDNDKIEKDLPIQYLDYAVWQREILQGEHLRLQLHYWQKQLSNVSVLDLATDWPRPTVQTYNGATLRTKVPDGLMEILEQHAENRGATLFMLTLAAFNVLLLRYTGQHDVAVGVPIAGRNRDELESLIGLFVNTLVMRTDLSGDPQFHDLLDQTKAMCLDAFAHQDVPFEQLVEVLKPNRELSYTPLFQVMFAFQNVPPANLHLPNLKWTPLDIATKTAKFDLTLDIRLNLDNGLFYTSTIATCLPRRPLPVWEIIFNIY